MTPQAADEGDPARRTVDLLFFGGIGTYMRAVERKRRGGRRPRQRCRSASPARDLRCKVIGEGANLGMTQRGRIEAALARHPAQHRRHRQFRRRQHLRRRGQHQDRAQPRRCAPGALTLEARNALLAEMTDEVGAAGAAQQLSADAGALAGAAARPGGSRLPAAADADAGSSAASSTARWNSCPTRWRSPSGASATQPLTRPELAVLLAYAKLSLYSELLDIERAGRSLSRPRARALFPEGDVGALSRRAAHASAAARDHRHAAHQFDDQPRRRRR